MQRTRASLVTRIAALLCLCAGAWYAAGSRAAAQIPGAPQADIFGADVRFGMDETLPDTYRKISGIAQFPWAGTAAQYGARINRHSFDWQSVEPQRGTFDFRVPEAFVQSDSAHSMLTIGVLEHTPYWASTVNTGNPGPQVPAGLDQPWDSPDNTWGQYVYATASHFRGRVAYWEVWNEPDLYRGAGWSGSRTQFFQLLKVAYLAIKAADPTAIVISGSLNYNPSWLSDVLAADVVDPQAAAHAYYFDAVGIHSYGRASGIYELSHLAASVLAQYGILGKPVIATELGIPVDDDPRTSTHGLVGTGDEAASYVIEASAAALAGGIDKVLFYRASDVGQPGYWGMFRTSGAARKPAAAFRVAARYFQNVQGARLVDSDPITTVTLDEGQQRVTVLWNNAPGDTQATLYHQSADGAQVVDKYGHVSTLQADSAGYYHLAIPGATNNHGATSSDFIIGGGPLVVVEQGPFVPPLTATPTSTPAPTSSATASATQTGTAPAAGPGATAEAFPSGSAPPTAIPTATFPPDAAANYFAEGSTEPPYAEYLNIANPNRAPARLRLTFGGPSGPISVTGAVAAPHALTTIDLSSLHLPPGPITTSILADRPVASQRTLYYGDSAAVGGGASSPAYTWYLPGLAAAAPSSQIVAVSNPGPEAAGLSVETIAADGSRRFFTSHVAPYGRRAFVIARGAHDPDLATIVTADQPVVAEYTAYLQRPIGITGSLGISDLSRIWLSAESYHNGAWGEHLAVLNPNSVPARLTIDLYLPNPPLGQGHPMPYASETVQIPAAMRSTIDVGAIAPAGAFTMAMTSTVPIAVNRVANYGPGQRRAAVSAAVERPARGWLFPTGDTAPPVATGASATNGAREFILLTNPSNTTSATVSLVVVDPAGRTLRAFRYLLRPHQRVSVEIGHAGRHTTQAISTNGVPIVAEQSVFFANGLGGFTAPGVPLG